jgi:SAM-dependent methyltransferase
MSQNIYDDDGFFENYSKLPRSVDGLAAAPEWKVISELLPSLDGKRVLDLGCGFGYFAKYASEQKAGSVLATDLSEKMLERARRENGGPGIAFRREDLESFELPQEAFDFAYSSLVVHYVTDLNHFLATVASSLVSGGLFVYTTEHPICTAPSVPNFIQHEGRTIWPLDSYSDAGERITNWMAPGVKKQHRTIATHVNSLVAAGFAVEKMIEWSPSKEQVEEHPEWKDERERPYFLILKGRKL